MINESAISRECMAKTMARAKSVAKNGGFVYNRRIDYEPDYTILRACVESSSWSDYPYDVRVQINEDTGSIDDYECTCPAHYRYPGMCKHSAGLVMIYNNEPETFRGYSASKVTSTSRSIANLMKRMSAQSALPKSAEDAEQTGSIYLEATLEQSRFDRWSACFKVASPTASYVIKDISEFLECLNARAYHEYGKKLAFTHSKDMFTAQGWEVASWLKQTTASSSGWWKQYDWQSGGAKRHIYLSSAQVVALLDLYQGMSIDFVEIMSHTGRPHTMKICMRNPELSLDIEALPDGAYELHRVQDLGFVSYEDRIYAFDKKRFYRCSAEFSACADFLQTVYMDGEERLTVSGPDMPLFCSAVLPVLQKALTVTAPQELDALKPVPGVIEFYLDSAPSGAECKAKALYGDAEYQLMDPRQEAGKPKRDEAMEAAARMTLERYLPVLDEEMTSFTQDDDDMARLLFHGVDELRRHGEVFTTDAFDKRKAARRPSVQTGLSVESNLVNLTVSAEDMTPEEIAALLESYKGKKKYHKLKDGTFIDMEQQAAEELKDLAKLEIIAEELGLDVADILSGMITIDPYHAFLLNALAEDEEKDESFQAFIHNFTDGRGTKHPVPEEVTTILRPYQVEGFNWLNTLVDTNLCGILADEMGLGKSLQIISLLLCHKEELSQKPALIVCPASLVYNWKAEFRKFAPSMRVAVLAGSKPHRDEVRTSAEYDVIVASYDTLRVDIVDMEDAEFSFQVIDEAQYIKNHSTKAAKAVKAVKAEHRIALTGTPIENRLSELWSIFDYLMPGMLGSYRVFRERYEAPIIAGDEETAKRLSSKVGPFILRRLKRDVLDDLPDKLETIIHAHFEDEQQTLYTAHETRLRQSLTQGSDEDLKSGKIAVLAELTKLRQICCDPRLLYDGYNDEGAKMEAICELVENAVDNGEKVLIFSQFTSFLDLIAKNIESSGWKHYTITGSTPKKERMELVDRFNNDDVPVFLISLKAGGTGLNLIGASVVIHADPWWNAAAQNQATDRAHRIGQTKDVSVFKVIAEGTIEERILELQEAKSNLADAVLEADGASLGTMSRDELISLLTTE